MPISRVLRLRQGNPWLLAASMATIPSSIPAASLHRAGISSHSFIWKVQCSKNCNSTSSDNTTSSSVQLPLFSPLVSPSIVETQSPAAQHRFSITSSSEAIEYDSGSSLASKRTNLQRLPPLPKQYLDPKQPGARVPHRKPLMSMPHNRKRFPGVDQWGQRAVAVEEAAELLRQADISKEAVNYRFHSWTKYIAARDIVAIIDREPSWQKALAFFKCLKEKGTYELNVYVYNVLLKCLRKGEQWEIANNLVEEMIQDGVKPDKVTYSTLISFAMRCQLPEESLKWYRMMQVAGCHADAVTYNTMIDVYGRMGCMEEAFDIFHKLRKENIRLGIVTYSTIIRLHGIQGNYDAILHLYDEMSQKAIIPNAVTFNIMIGALGKARRVDQVTRLFTDMRRLGVRPSVITVSLLIRTYGKCGMVNEAFKVFNSVEKEGWKADTTIHNAILNICAEQGLVSAGEQIFKEMETSDSLYPDIWTWRTLINMYALKGMMVEALRMFQQMLGAGHPSDTAVYTSLIKGYSIQKDFKAVVELFEKLIGEGVPVDEHLTGALLSAYVFCGGEESQPILDCINRANPRLGSVVELLIQDDFDFEAGRTQIQGLFTEIWDVSRIPFCNMLIDLCWARNFGDRTHAIFALGNQIGVYSELDVQSASEWCLKLQPLSFGAALTALRSWIHALSCAVQEGIALPPNLCIETGTGRPGTPYEMAMSTFVRSQIKEMQAPFKETTERQDWFVAAGEAFKFWLQSQKSSVS